MMNMIDFVKEFDFMKGRRLRSVRLYRGAPLKPPLPNRYLLKSELGKSSLLAS